MARGRFPTAPLLIPPLGASAVLLFSAPDSTFARPYALVGGNCLAAAIGVTCAKLPLPIAMTAIAVGLTTADMMVCRCVHPPSGGVALVAVLTGPQAAGLGYRFVLVPVLLNTVLLLLTALAYNGALRWKGWSDPKPATSSLDLKCEKCAGRKCNRDES